MSMVPSVRTDGFVEPRDFTKFLVRAFRGHLWKHATAPAGFCEGVKGHHIVAPK
jgi:hypothetical protein